MLVDLSILVTKYVNSAAIVNQKIVAFGHLGTHFDVMDKEFPLAFVKRNGIIFNVKGIFDRDISIADIDLTLIEPDMFVAFFSNITEKIEYGSKEYFANHPQLSNELIDQLLKKRISIIGIDFAGIRRGFEHTLKDQYCADRDVFVVENLCNLHSIVNKEKYKNCVINTYPIRFAGLSGLPCRVVAEV
jgi:kynurenine formamidase